MPPKSETTLPEVGDLQPFDLQDLVVCTKHDANASKIAKLAHKDFDKFAAALTKALKAIQKNNVL